MKVYHVVPQPGRGWRVKRSGASRATRVGFATRAAARDWAWGRRAVDEVVLHKATGEIDRVERGPN